MDAQLESESSLGARDSAALPASLVGPGVVRGRVARPQAPPERLLGHNADTAFRLSLRGKVRFFSQISFQPVLYLRNSV